jgi:hypothetical protein
MDGKEGEEGSEEGRGKERGVREIGKKRNKAIAEEIMQTETNTNEKKKMKRSKRKSIMSGK